MLKQTSLYHQHLKLNATMAPFAGYDMPIQYTSVKEEILAVREKVGVFDVSHMGEFFVQGPDAIKFVNYIITNEFQTTPIGKAVYSPLCRHDGTVIDDLIVYKLNSEKVLICVNASNIDKDWQWINSVSAGFNCQLTNASHAYSLVAIQGPKSPSTLIKLGILSESEANQMEYYSILEKNVFNESLIIARTGYTGEDGFEIFASHLYIAKLWEQLLGAEVTPCGLAARDVLRLEVCYPLYGHEINDDVTPLDAGLSWTVKLTKENFIGKEALSTYKPKYQLVKLSLNRGIPREGYLVTNEKGESIGKITSGTMSVMNNFGVALALIEKTKLPSDKKIYINIRNNNFEAKYHTQAFFNGGHK